MPRFDDQDTELQQDPSAMRAARVLPRISITTPTGPREVVVDRLLMIGSAERIEAVSHRNAS